MKHNLHIALTLLMAATMAGCSSDSDSNLFVKPGMQAGDVNFTINVYAGDPEGTGSRAGVLPGDDYFEGPQYDYERMRTLRVIIVRPNGLVEHNEYIYRTIPDAGLGEYRNISLRVIGGETKSVYPFANEESMFTSGNGAPAYDFNSIRIGSQFPKDEIENLKLTCAAGEALIDNTGADKLHVPMSELFDIDVKAPGPDGEDLYQDAYLFITRAAVKFSFNIQAALSPFEEYTIEELAVESIGNSEYLLPRDCSYVPGKYPVQFEDRYITTYTVPDDAQTASYSFFPNMTFTPSTPANTPYTFAPEIYLPETASRNGGYVVKMRLKGDNDYSAQATLPNLPSLPRNTHVKVNITMGIADIDFTVDVLPYTAVPLNPTFGFDEMLPRPPVLPGEVPPWLVIPDTKDTK